MNFWKFSSCFERPYLFHANNFFEYFDLIFTLLYKWIPGKNATWVPGKKQRLRKISFATFSDSGAIRVKSFFPLFFFNLDFFFSVLMMTCSLSKFYYVRLSFFLCFLSNEQKKCRLKGAAQRNFFSKNILTALRSRKCHSKNKFSSSKSFYFDFFAFFIVHIFYQLFFFH